MSGFFDDTSVHTAHFTKKFTDFWANVSRVDVPGAIMRFASGDANNVSVRDKVRTVLANAIALGGFAEPPQNYPPYYAYGANIDKKVRHVNSQDGLLVAAQGEKNKRVFFGQQSILLIAIANSVGVPGVV